MPCFAFRPIRPGVLAGLVLAALAGTPGEVEARTARRVAERSGDWRLIVRRDPFAETASCRISNRRARVVWRRGALGFRFKRSLDVSDAVYRLDGGVPRAWRDDLPELVRLRVEIDGRDLRAPTDGIVWIPLGALRGVATVQVQPRRGARARAFDVRGFDDASARAERAGCPTGAHAAA